MSARFDKLTAPARLGSLTLRNRMIVGAMGVNLAEEDGSCGDAIIDFHARQAEGGVGLIVVGSAGVSWPVGGNEPRQVAVSEDRHIPGLARLADAVHAHGARLALQLHHGGMVATEDPAAGRPLRAPSYPLPAKIDLPSLMLESEIGEMFGSTPVDIRVEPLTVEEIHELTAQFAAGAARAKQAGVDGVELHAGHGYILSEFLSPVSNQRDDAYGGSLDNRARFLLEVIAAIRAAVGRDYPLWVKLDSEEIGKPEGISLADACATARLVERAGADAIAVSAYHDTARGALHSESNIPHVPERLVAAARAVRRVVSIPVIATGRIEPERAERQIARGDYDFLALGRKLLADPDLPRKLTDGKPDSVRPCVYCYCCASQIYLRRSIKCAVNAEIGFERARRIVATSAARRYVVVGGGPAGMEAALRLEQAGHRVTLFESRPQLGGTLAFASIAYAPNQDLLDWQRRQLEASTVDLRLGVAANLAEVKSLAPDAVIVATGARRDMPELPGAEQDFVFSGEEMRALVVGEAHPDLRRKTSLVTRTLARLGSVSRLASKPQVVRQVSRVWMPLGRRVVVIGAELVGLELAEFLAERGRQVTVIDSPKRAGRGLYLVRRMRLLHELREHGVVINTKARDLSIGDHCVSYTNFRGQRRTVAADHVVVARGALADTSFADAMRNAGLAVHTIGDCTGVRFIEGAIESAAELVAALQGDAAAAQRFSANCASTAEMM